ncbi:unnamed protein product [Cyclocybe aegerita]|uniref:F-box domain-containing protein n=1 Tax=Cyclocybe aegerita TaxID=1973307 RepID=A0A8S0W6T8_CYCAE|nr:unnamed protein product [Cyclocybe aegerita]
MPGIKHLECTNSALSPQDEHLVRGLASDIDLHLKKLDTELEEIMQRYQDRRATLLLQRKPLTSLLSGMRRFPGEIFREIFLYIAVEDSAELIPSAQVCRRWREIALEFPELWTNIVLGSSKALTEQQSRGILQILATRSKEWPLSLTLRVVPEMDVNWFYWMPDLLKEFVFNKPWRSLIAFDDLAKTTLDPEKNARSLETLQSLSIIDTYCWPYFLSDLNKRNIAKAIPNVTSLTISALTKCPSPYSRLVSWKKLTSLKITSNVMSWLSCFQILSDCASLEEADVRTSKEVDPTPTDIQILVMPHLRRMSMSSDKIPQMLPQFLSTPVLEELVISFWEDITVDDDQMPLLEWILDAAPTLRTLQIPGQVELRALTLEHFSDFPSPPPLEELAITPPNRSPIDIFCWLTVQDEKVLFPRLKQLEFLHNSTTSKYDIEYLQKLIDSRRSAGLDVACPLRRVVWEVDGEMLEESSEIFSDLSKAKGFKVAVPLSGYGVYYNSNNFV